MNAFYYKPCPFCGAKVSKIKGFQGLMFFKCQNRGKCGAVVSFDNAACNLGDANPELYWNRRAGDER